jgi:hypothetical protein
MLDYAVSMKYMLAGYVVILSILAIYLVSLVVRWRNLKRDIEVLRELQGKPT